MRNTSKPGNYKENEAYDETDGRSQTTIHFGPKSEKKEREIEREWKKKKSRYVNNPLNSAKVSFLRRTTFTPGETLFTPWSMLEDFKGGFGEAEVEAEGHWGGEGVYEGLEGVESGGVGMWRKVECENSVLKKVVKIINTDWITPPA